MTKPLALVFYENLLLGTQLVSRLHDIGYRVLTVVDAASLETQSEKEKPLVVIVNWGSRQVEVCASLKALRQKPVTAHIPVLAVAKSNDLDACSRVRECGVTLVAGDEALLAQLPELLEQVLQMD